MNIDRKTLTIYRFEESTQKFTFLIDKTFTTSVHQSYLRKNKKVVVGGNSKVYLFLLDDSTDTPTLTEVQTLKESLVLIFF